MKTRLAFILIPTAVILSLFATPVFVTQINAQNPSYLSQMPLVQRVMSEVRGPDARETAIRQICAFWQLQEIVKSLAGPREIRGLTSDENLVIQAYAAASYQVEQTFEKSLTPAEKNKFENDAAEFRFAREDPAFGVEGLELFKQFFSPAFRDQFRASLSAAKARHDAFGKTGDDQLAKEKAAQAAQYAELLKTPEGQQLAQAAQAAVAHPPTEAEQKQAEARRCVAAGRDPTQCMTEELSGGLKDLFGGAIPGLTPDAPPPGLRMSGVYPGMGGFSLVFYDDTVSVGCGKIEPAPHLYTIAMQPTQTLITVAAQPKPLTFAFGADGKLTGPGPVQLTGQVVVGYKTEYEYNLRTGVHTGRTIQVPVYQTQTLSCTAGAMLTSGSTPAAKGVTSALADVFGFGQTARDITSTAETGPVPPGLRMNGTYAGQGGLTVQFHVDTAVVDCRDVSVAHPYTVAQTGNQIVVKIQDTTPIVLAIRPDSSLSGPTGAIAVNGRVVTGSDDNTNKLTYAARSATCSAGILAPQR